MRGNEERCLVCGELFICTSGSHAPSRYGHCPKHPLYPASESSSLLPAAAVRAAAVPEPGDAVPSHATVFASPGSPRREPV